jgi:hypothetical protein
MPERSRIKEVIRMQDDNRAFMPYPPQPVAHALSGPLSGMTFAVKDLFDVAGYPTGGGNPHLLALSGIKRRTAPVVQSCWITARVLSVKPTPASWPTR